jgi:hypothetical protein
MATRVLSLVALISMAMVGTALLATSVRGAGSTATGRPEVTIANSRRVEFVSKINGHRYVLSVALPFNKAPEKGYSVLYVLDGYWYFASASEIAHTAANVVVVGIGYPVDLAYAKKVIAERGPLDPFYAGMAAWRISPFLERLYDLALPASDEELAAQTPPGTQKQTSRNVGGIDDFLKIIETEVKPRIAALAPIDRTNQVLFGHSLGGLAVLHALFVEPNAFRTFIIASPSIWWGNKEVLSDEEKFHAAVNNSQTQPRVLVTVGAEEDAIRKVPASSGIDQAALEAFRRKNPQRMVANATELVTRLKALRGGPGYKVEDCAVFDREGHGVAAWSALARGIPFAFSDTP